jgi:P-type Cu2+ transporter
LKSGQALPVSSVLAAGEADFPSNGSTVRRTRWFEAGSRLPAGAILLSRAPAEVNACEKWEDSLLAKLTAPVGADRGTPGLDRLLRVYLSIVLVLGLVAQAYWGWHGDWITGAQAMISVFVVSCPCALGWPFRWRTTWRPRRWSGSGCLCATPPCGRGCGG